MACTKPLPAIWQKGMLRPEFLKFSVLYPNYDSVVDKVRSRGQSLVMFPCGRCDSCRMAHSKMWASRVELESRSYKENWFLTLTYNNENVPVVYDDKGNVQLSLRKRDLQLFWKRLRKAIGSDRKIRYFACSEYGGRTHRPHYHAIVFNLHIDDLRDSTISGATQNKLGDKYYVSDWLDSIWQKGNVMIGKVTLQSAGYVARYTLKKSGVRSREIDYGLREPECLTMSNGIGLDYFNLHKDEIYANDDILTFVDGKPIHNRPSRYFDKKMFDVDPDFIDKVKDKRILRSSVVLDSEMCNNDYGYVEMFRRRHDDVRSRLKSLHDLRKKV